MEAWRHVIMPIWDFARGMIAAASALRINTGISLPRGNFPR
jgi:hypothetical protein